MRILVADSVEGGLFAPLAAGGTLFEAVRVDANGAISLPYAGRLKVQGKSPPAIEEMVKGSLRHSAAVQPQVMVDLADRPQQLRAGGRRRAAPRPLRRHQGAADGPGRHHAGRRLHAAVPLRPTWSSATAER